MGVPTTLRGISGTASNNSPAGTDAVGSTADDYLRGIQASIRQYLAGQSATVVAAATTDLTTATGHWVPISGNTTITGLGSEDAGIEYILTFSANPVIVNSTALALPGGANFSASTGDVCVAESLGSGNWKIWGYTPFSGPQKLTNSLGADVTLTTAGIYYDGPSVAQGTSGIWLAFGQVTIQSSLSGAAQKMGAKLWDGTTVIASAGTDITTVGDHDVIALSGYIASPAGNIRISVTNFSQNGGNINFNYTVLGKDSTLSVIRIA